MRFLLGKFPAGHEYHEIFMGQQRDNVKRRRKRAAKASKVWLATELVDTFNTIGGLSSPEGPGSPGLPKRRAQRHSQTVRFIELDQQQNQQIIIQEVFVVLAGIDADRIKVLRETVRRQTEAYNELERAKAAAGDTERVRIKLSQSMMLEALCPQWWELHALCLRVSRMPLRCWLNTICPQAALRN